MCQDNSCSMHQRSCWTQFARGLVLLISPSGTSWTTWQLGDSCACWMTGPRPIRAWLFTIPQAVMYRLDCARSSISFGRSVLDSSGRSEICGLALHPGAEVASHRADGWLAAACGNRRPPTDYRQLRLID